MRARIRPVILGAAVVVGLALTVVTAPAALARTPQRLDFTTIPGPPWETGGTVSLSNGILNVGPQGSLLTGLEPDDRGDWWGTVDNILGWTVSARVRLDSSLASTCDQQDAQLVLADHTIDVAVSFGTDGVCLRSGYSDVLSHAMDTQSAFHTYRIDVKGASVRLSVDGTQVLSVQSPPSNSFIGAWVELIAVAGRQLHIDWLSYDTTPSLPACTITGTSGDDVLTGTPGPDVICGLDGNDRLYGDGGSDVLIGGFGDDQLFGGAGRDVLVGDAGNDFLEGDGGADTMYGGPDDDTFHATRGGSAARAVADGPDVMVGGDGIDTADYSRRLLPVTVTLDGNANDGQPGEDDQVGVFQDQQVTAPDVEAVNGGSAGDTITGSSADNVLVGYGGHDTIRGLGGDDTIDVLDNAAGDTANGGRGQDTCVGDTGDTVTACETLLP
jgi:Ca2+-binding RTX toxin-like protein